MEKKSIKPKKWEFLTAYQPTFTKDQWLPGVDFSLLFDQMTKAKIEHLKVTFEEVVDWDRAPMRSFFHGVEVPAFVKKYNETCMNDMHGYFHADFVKDFLKAKFIGWDESSPNWSKWANHLGMDKPIKDIFSFIQIQKLNETLKPQIEVASSEDLTPEEYMILINRCETYYFELFQCMFDVREKPNGV